MWAGVVVAIALLTLTLAVNPDRLRWALPVAAAGCSRPSSRI